MCSVDEDTGVLGIEGAGSCTITAAAAATDDGNYQATSVTFELTVDQASQTLTGFAYSPATVTFGGTAPTLTAPSGAQGTLSYASSDTAAAAATDDGNYQATSVTFELTWTRRDADTVRRGGTAPTLTAPMTGPAGAR